MTGDLVGLADLVLEFLTQIGVLLERLLGRLAALARRSSP